MQSQDLKDGLLTNDNSTNFSILLDFYILNRYGLVLFFFQTIAKFVSKFF